MVGASSFKSPSPDATKAPPVIATGRDHPPAAVDDCLAHLAIKSVAPVDVVASDDTSGSGENAAEEGRRRFGDRTSVGNAAAGEPSKAPNAPPPLCLYIFGDADVKKFIQDNPGIVQRRCASPEDRAAAENLIREKNYQVQEESLNKEMFSEVKKLFRKV